MVRLPSQNPTQGHPYHTAGLTCLDIHPDSTAAITGPEDGVPKVGWRGARGGARWACGGGANGVGGARHVPLAGGAALSFAHSRPPPPPPPPPPLPPPPLLHPQVVSLHNGRVVASLGGGHDEDSSVEAVAFSRHLPHVALSAGMDGKLVVWDLGTVGGAAASTRAICQHAEVRGGALGRGLGWGSRQPDVQHPGSHWMALGHCGRCS